MIALALGIALSLFGLLLVLDAVGSAHRGNDLAGLQAIPAIWMLVAGGALIVLSGLGMILRRRGASLPVLWLSRGVLLVLAGLLCLAVGGTLMEAPAFVLTGAGGLVTLLSAGDMLGRRPRG